MSFLKEDTVLKKQQYVCNNEGWSKAHYRGPTRLVAAQNSNEILIREHTNGKACIKPKKPGFRLLRRNVRNSCPYTRSDIF